MTFKINDSVTWVGKIDWPLRRFHGEELSTNHGSSYNAYLVHDEKTVLIDTVWTPYAEEFIARLEQVIDLKKIDYIVANHGEPDHSGALGLLMEKIPTTPIYCTANGVKSLKGYFGKDWDFRSVKTGDKLNIGKKELLFVEAAMIHWPDSMMCYLTGDNMLFSNDAFGQHFASEVMYNDLVDQCELFWEALKYYACIVSPFSKKVVKKVEELKSRNITIDMICPSHGIIWRSNPMQIVERYEKWANSYQEDQITIFYESMYNSTRKMAEAIARGIKEQDSNTTVKIYNIANSDKSDVLTEMFRSKGVLVGSANRNSAPLSNVAAMLDELEIMAFENKKAGVFISYGWSPIILKHMTEKLAAGGFEIVGEGVKAQFCPDKNAINNCIEYGKKFAASF